MKIPTIFAAASPVCLGQSTALAVTAALYLTIACGLGLFVLPEAAKDPDMQKPSMGLVIFILILVWPMTLVAIYLHNEGK